jgi:hypothetical protein
MRNGPFALSLVAGALLASACNGSSASVTPEGWRGWYGPLPAHGVALCKQLAGKMSVPVLCPATILVPRGSVHPRLTFYGGPVDRHGRFYELNVLYGSPSSGVTKPQTHTPRLFFHFGLAGGRFTNGQVAFNYRLGDSGKRSARRIGRAVLAGIRGTLWMGRPWPAGGIWGGHLMFIWHHGRYRYLATLHTWLSLTQPREVLARMIGSLTLAEHLKSSHPHSRN